MQLNRWSWVLSFVVFFGSFTKHCVCWVHGHLVLGSITNQPLSVCECHIAWSGPVSLVISNDFHFSMLEDAHTGIGGAQIDANRWSFRHLKQQNKKPSLQSNWHSWPVCHNKLTKMSFKKSIYECIYWLWRSPVPFQFMRRCVQQPSAKACTSGLWNVVYWSWNSHGIECFSDSWLVWFL